MCTKSFGSAHFPAEISPGSPLAMLVAAGEPQPACSPSPDVTPRPVAATVLVHPRTDDAVLCSQTVGDLAEDLDVLQKRSEIQIGPVVGLPRGPGGSGLGDLGDRMI